MRNEQTLSREGAPLSNDELGEAAESLFKLLCDRACLHCNKSGRDRAGWDFVVDFPLPESGGTIPLDQRQKTRCNIQLKASASGNRAVSLKLSAAEQLAKDAQPAFIVHVRLRRDGEPLKGYLIHLLGDPLAKLLRRLREAEARGRHDTHNLKISFDHRRHGQPFDLTPDGLRNALATACGPDPATYVQEKLRQLDELGYDDARIVGNALFRVESEDHLSRVLLGVEPLRPVRLETFDTRFGIPIPYASDLFSELEEIMVEPPSAGVCVIAITGPPLAPAAIFRTEMLFAPPFDGELRMLLRHPDISVRFKETDAAYEAECVFTDRARSLADMVTLLRALTYLESGKAIMSLTGEGGSFGPIRQPLSTPLTGPYLEDLPALARLASDWQSLLELAGIPSRAALTMDDLWSAHRASLAADLLLHTEKKAGFAFDRNELVETADGLKAIYFDSCDVGGEGISYSVEVTLKASEDNPDVFRSVAFNPIEVIPKVGDLDDYMDDLAERFGPRVMIHPDHVRRVDPPDLEMPDAPALSGT